MNTNSLACVAELLERRLCLNAAGFVDVIDNPYFPLIPGTTFIYRGIDDDGNSIRNRVLVTNQTKVIQGVTCTVVRDREYENGELIEDTRDFYAQDVDGNVLYFGEKSQEIEDGQVVGTGGSWEAGVNGATPGIIMKANPGVGDTYQQENAPGVAEDRARVRALDVDVTAPFGTFGDCLKTEESNPLEPGNLEHKFYAPGIGLVREHELPSGGEALRLAYVQLAPEAFSSTIDNPFFPLVPGTTFVYRGVDEDGNPIGNRFQVTHETRQILGVTTTVVRDREFVNGELVEDTRDFFAQDKVGNVWYFGEDSKEIEDGQVVSTDGSWLAGVNGAVPGFIMKAQPRVGDTYHQETAVGVAEDQAQVLSRRATVTVPFGTFGNCLKTSEFTALEPDVLEHKYFARGIGLIKAQAILGGTENVRLAYILT